MKLLKVLFFSCALVLLCSCASLYADTVIMNDGKEMKGIVVEDYKDRIVLSTADGEITLMKSDLRELYFNSEEDNLIKLAEQAMDRKDYTKAFVYYDKALKLNPKSRTAQDGIVFLQGYLYRQEQVRKEEDMKKMEAVENFGAAIPEDMTAMEKSEAQAKKLKETMGLALKMEGGFPVAETVLRQTPAADAGIEKGDRLVAVWAKLTGYMSPGEVIDLLLDKPSLELKIAIEREFDVKLDWENATGASLSMEFDGLTVDGVKEFSPAFRAGVKKGDLIIAINGQSTRYMPLNKAKELIKHSKEESVRFTIRREAIIWRKS